MNIQLGNVLSDLSGVSGMKIIGTILEGERDPWKLAASARPEIKATPDDLAKSLEWNWRKELLFVLKQEVDLYRFYQEQIVDCDLNCANIWSRSAPVWISERSPSGRSRRARRAVGTHPTSICARSYIALRALTGHKSTA